MAIAWKKIAAKVSGILCSAAVMAGCMGADTALAVERTYTVKSGDTLKKIAREQYGSDDWWEVLEELNQDQIDDPNLIYTGWELKLSADSSELVERSDCSVSVLVKYLDSQGADQESVKEFLRQGTWPVGISVPARDSVLTSDGAIDWTQAPQNGYQLDESGAAIKEIYVPQVGEVVDRYGSAGGRYTSPMIGGQPYAYDQRSLPYVEDDSSYHIYQVTGDISQLENYVNSCTDETVVSIVRDSAAKYYEGDISKMVVWKGTTAAAFGCAGGAMQYEFPLSMDVLCSLGILQEIQ